VSARAIKVSDDVEPPSIVCPDADLTQEVPASAQGLVISYPLPVAADNRVGAKLKQLAGPASGEFFPVGATKLSFVVTDAVGLTAQCSFTITVRRKEGGGITGLQARIIPPLTATQGQATRIDLSPYFSPSGNQALTYFVADLPVGSGLMVEFDSGALVGTPSQADARAPQPLRLRVMVSDGKTGRVVQDVEIRVKPDPTNTAPIIAPLFAGEYRLSGLPVVEAEEGSALSTQLTRYFTVYLHESYPLGFVYAIITLHNTNTLFVQISTPHCPLSSTQLGW
jgi:hypothetical protein